MRNNHNIKRYAKGFALLLMLVFTSLCNYAQVYPVEYLEDFLDNNPDLKARHKAYEASLQQSAIISSLPDPTLTAGFFTPPMDRLMGKQWFDLSAMQMFPWFGSLQKQKIAADQTAEALYHHYRDQRNQLLMEMTRLWLQIYQKEQALQIITHYIELLHVREDIIYTRYGGGQQISGLNLDIYRLEIQLSGLETRREKLQEERLDLIQRFNIITGRSEMAQVNTPENLPEKNHSDKFLAQPESQFASNPALNREQLKAKAATTEKELSRLKTRPMLGLGLQYSYFAPGDPTTIQMDGGHMIMPMVSVSLPIYRKKNRAIQEQSLMLADLAEYNIESQINTLQSQWTTLQASVKNLYRDLNFYQQQIVITKKAEHLIINAYASGDEGFDELLRLQDQLLDLEWRLLEARVALQLKLAEMDLVMARNIFQ